ncbi:MAG: hypothetical protein MUF49_25470 [Oculatellaceae cyanobacterium Prado106]|nr:hypothetical protein [Oculatellaceae cyanobacterium Prado106]
MTYSTQGVDLDTTIATLSNPTEVPLEDAIALIESWQQQLQGNDIAEDLGELKEALQQGTSGEISQILADLGADTSETAMSLPVDMAEKVQQIGKLLSQAADI